MKIRVLHVVLSMETGGLENGIVNLTNHSDQNDFVVDILCLRERGELADRITNPNSQVLFDENRDSSIITATKKIYRAAKAGQYHIIHAHGFSTMLATYLANMGLKDVIIINGEHGTLYHDSLKQRILQKFLFSRMDLNLTVSRDLKQKILTLFSVTKDNFKPIINGVDTERFKPRDKNAIRQTLSIPDDAIVIGSVGRLVAVKDFPTLIEAFAKLDTSSKLHLVLVGDGTERQSLEALVSQKDLTDRVTFTGRRDDVNEVVSCFDLFVLPSLSEGLSNTLLEAMSCGIPVLGSNVGGNPEIIDPDHSGYLFDVGNTEQLRELLQGIINDPEKLQALSTTTRHHILDNHSLKNMVSNYEDTYRDLCALHQKHLMVQPTQT